MAKRIVRVCDNPGGKPCNNTAREYKLWREGDGRAYSIDLCDTHAKSVLVLMEHAEPVDLPSKPRITMRPTALKTTKATSHLKKGVADGA